MMPFVDRRGGAGKLPIVPTANAVDARLIREDPKIARILEVEDVAASGRRYAVPAFHGKIPAPEVERPVEGHPHPAVGSVKEAARAEIWKRAGLPERHVFIQAILRNA